MALETVIQICQSNYCTCPLSAVSVSVRGPHLLRRVLRSSGQDRGLTEQGPAREDGEKSFRLDFRFRRPRTFFSFSFFTDDLPSSLMLAAGISLKETKL